MARRFDVYHYLPAIKKAKLYHLRPKILPTKWRMDIDESGYWKPHIINSPALSVPKTSNTVAVLKKINEYFH
jgi:hypothetical protein